MLQTRKKAVKVHDDGVVIILTNERRYGILGRTRIGTTLHSTDSEDMPDYAFKRSPQQRTGQEPTLMLSEHVQHGVEHERGPQVGHTMPQTCNHYMLYKKDVAIMMGHP